MSLLFDNDTDDDTFVDTRVRWLESNTCPEYASTGMFRSAPHILLLVYGKWLKRKVVITSFDVMYGPLWVPGSLYPAEAKVDLTLTEFVTESVDYRRIRV